jgi:hypothetical protein
LKTKDFVSAGAVSTTLELRGSTQVLFSMGELRKRHAAAASSSNEQPQPQQLID